MPRKRIPGDPRSCALQRDQTVPKAALPGGTPRPAGQTQPSPLRREPETLFLYGQARLRSFVNLIENKSKPWESSGGWTVAIGAACAQRGAGWARRLLPPQGFSRISVLSSSPAHKATSPHPPEGCPDCGNSPADGS